MASGKKKLHKSLEQLKKAIATYENSDRDDELQFLALSKAFEIAVEYAWRDLKKYVEEEGLEAQSPKAAVRQAAKLGIIKEPDQWLLCIDARNDSVHDYFGIPESEYVGLIKKFIELADFLLSHPQ